MPCRKEAIEEVFFKFQVHIGAALFLELSSKIKFRVTRRENNLLNQLWWSRQSFFFKHSVAHEIVPQLLWETFVLHAMPMFQVKLSAIVVSVWMSCMAIKNTRFQSYLDSQIFIQCGMYYQLRPTDQRSFPLVGLPNFLLFCSSWGSCCAGRRK